MVFFEDECHLLWGDLCGYVWAAAIGVKLPERVLGGIIPPKISHPETCLGKTSERIEVPIVNERSKQTYYGALNVHTQQCLIQAADAGNSEGTIAFLKYLLGQYPDSRIALIWDGATYHRSQEVRAYLETVNRGFIESNWKITCIRFAPNDPKQNPIEDIWLQAKRLIREYYHLCKSFGALKVLFELATHRQTFDFPKLFTYGFFSQII